jgi:hypothetical protein
MPANSYRVAARIKCAMNYKQTVLACSSIIIPDNISCYRPEVCLCTHLDGRREVIFSPVLSHVRWFWLKHLIFPNILRVMCVHACLFGKGVVWLPCSLCYQSCIHYVLRRVIVINQACTMRWTGVMSWSGCQASSCFAGNAKLFP